MLYHSSSSLVMSKPQWTWNCRLILLSQGKTNRTFQTRSQRRLESSYLTTNQSVVQPLSIYSTKSDSLKATNNLLALRWAHTNSTLLKTQTVRRTVPKICSFEDSLRKRLVEMYLDEENLVVATPEHWKRSQTELDWLKIGASQQILRRSSQSISPTSLNQHIQPKTGNQRLFDKLLADWVDQHVSKRKPLAYILGNLPFGDLTFTIRPPILIPRPETEQWVIELSRMMNSYFQAARSSRSSTHEFTFTRSATSKLSRPTSFKVLDIGTGSGCISNYLAYHHQDLHAIGVDINQDAVGLARENASFHKILCHNKSSPTNRNSRGRASFFNLDLFSPTFTQNLKQASQSLAGFDMIISNPPYIPLSDYQDLPRSVKSWESPLALIGDRNSRDLNGAGRLLSRSNRPSGDYGFFTSYRSSLFPSVSELQSVPGSGMEELDMTTVGRNETATGLMASRDQNETQDGLDFYRQILQLVATGGLLKADSSNFHHRSASIAQPLPKLVFEVGYDQATSVKNLVLQLLPGEVTQVHILKDFAGIDRTLLCY